MYFRDQLWCYNLAEFEMQYADKLSFASNTCGHKPCPKP